MREMEPILDETKGGEHLRLILVAAPLGWDGGTRGFKPNDTKMSMRIFGNQFGLCAGGLVSA